MDNFEILVSQIDDKVNQIKDHVCNGSEDTETYKRMCGEIRGLLLARSYIIDLKNNLEKTDDDSHWLKPQ